MARFLRYYAGYTWDRLLRVPYGVYVALLAEIPRIRAEETRAMVLAVHTGDPKDLIEQLDYEADPSRAWWMRQPDGLTELEAIARRHGAVEERTR